MTYTKVLYFLAFLVLAVYYVQATQIIFEGHFKDCTNGTEDANVDGNVTIGQLKAAFSRNHECPSRNVVFKFNQQVLNDNSATLDSLGVKNGDTVVVICRNPKCGTQ